MRVNEEIMPEQIHTTDAVFGVSRDLPLNYVPRDNVDTKFVESLGNQKHIVIYGSSKQGKTSLRKKWLNDDDYIIVACQNKWTLADLHGSILKECGFEIKQSSEKNVSGVNKITIGLDAKAKIPLISDFGGKAEYNHESKNDSKTVFRPIDLDPTDPNDVIRAMTSINFEKFVVLEDFHYLPDETQRDFSFSLKTFHEQSKFSFIIVGVWREENRLIGFNGDLTDRVLSVDVDTWIPEKLKEVIEAGEHLLNVKFNQKFTAELISRCFDSVHIVQEACRRACQAAGITKTQTEIRDDIGNDTDVVSLVGKVVEEQAARYKGFLMGFSDGFQDTGLEMPKWIIYAILCSNIEDLEKGVRLRKISKLIKSKHPKGDGLNNGNITQILKTCAALQNKKGTRPLVIDYDAANTSLNVVDKGFLIWLSSQDVNELLEELELPDRTTVE